MIEVGGWSVSEYMNIDDVVAMVAVGASSWRWLLLVVVPVVAVVVLLFY